MYEINDQPGLDDALATYHADGFVVLRDVLSGDEVQATRNSLGPYLETGRSGRNNFEGELTKRVYSLVGRGSIFERSAEHPRVLALVDRLLDAGYLLTASQAICIWPGETPQPIHYDDSFYPLTRPRKPISVSTIWALDDFTTANGGTELIRGSHQWNDEQVANSYRGNDRLDLDPVFAHKLQALEMTAGSCVLFAGTLLHRGGANRSDLPRRAFSHQYCEPWARQQENYFLSIPHGRAKAMSERLRRMLGYSIHPPFMGQVAGRHPQKVLGADYQNSLEQDDALLSASKD